MCVCVHVYSMALPLYCKFLDSEYKTIYFASLYTSSMKYATLYIVDAEYLHTKRRDEWIHLQPNVGNIINSYKS